MDKLDPCPFGCRAGQQATHNGTIGHGEKKISWVECDECQTQGPVRTTPEEAIEAWNRRATPAPKGEAPEIPDMFDAAYQYGYGDATEEEAADPRRVEAAWKAYLEQLPKSGPQGSPGTREAVEEAKRLIDLCTSECLMPANEDGPDRVGYMVGKDDGKSGLYVTPERAFSQSFPKIWAVVQQALGSQGKGAEVEAQPREGKASPGRECWVAFGMDGVCHAARKPEEKHHYLVYTRMVEADNQKGGT